MRQVSVKHPFSVYSHFSNKQDILDTAVEIVLKGYADHSFEWGSTMAGQIGYG